MDTNYEHDQKLGHEFYALTSRTDKCRNCGCMVNDCNNWTGENGSKFDEPCTKQASAQQ